MGNQNTSEYFETEDIYFLDSTAKNDAIEFMCSKLGESPFVKDKEELKKAIFYREELMSTGVGLGMGVPHVRLDSVEKLVMIVGICKKPVEDYESIDGKPVRLIFMIAAGKEHHAEYLKVLAGISSVVKDDKIRERLYSSESSEQFYKLITGVNGK